MEQQTLQNQDVQTSINNENMKIYNAVKVVPEDAQREIKGGKLKGFTDINPMWRIQALTEQFGPCGIGWKAPIVERWIDDGAGGEKILNVKIDLYIKHGDKWADPIDGIGGSMLIVKEKGQLVSNDEAYKMAYTDAISVACKSVGVGADVYYGKNKKDRSKYDLNAEDDDPETKTDNRTKYQIVKDLINGTSIQFAEVEKWLTIKNNGNKQINNISEELFNELIASLKAKINEANTPNDGQQNQQKE